MDRTKQWVALAVLAALVVLTGGWYLVVAPTRSEAAELHEQAELQDATNAQLATALDVLRDKAEKVPDQQAALAEAARRIPDGPALPDLLRALAATASSAGVELTSVSPTAPTPVAPEAPAAAAPPADPAEPAAPVDPTAAAPVAPAAPVAGTGLSAIDVTMVVAGDFYAVEQFVALLEELPRALRVTALTMKPGVSALSDDAAAGTDGRSVETTLTGRVYLSSAPTAPAATAPAAGAPVAPVAAPGQPSESVS